MNIVLYLRVSRYFVNFIPLWHKNIVCSTAVFVRLVSCFEFYNFNIDIIDF